MTVVGNRKKPPIIFLMGPTASGKTDLAIGLSEHLPIELVSVDSALVYKGLDIGSAKPTPEEQAQHPHRLIDICDPAEPYSVADFRRDALQAIEEIHQAGNIPLLVGGTMMYFKVLLEGIAEMPASTPEIREAIEQEAREKGWPAMHAQLAEVDPAMADELHPNHSQRIARALEVYRLSGRTMSQWRAEQQHQSLLEDYEVVQLALMPHKRELLHQRIAERFRKMVDGGFEQEVRHLYGRGDLHEGLPAIRAVGYRQMWEYVEGLHSWGEMIEKGIVATRQLAKRQLTWLRGWEALYPLYMDDSQGKLREKEEIQQEALQILSKLTIN